MEGIPETARAEVMIRTMISEAIKTSEIEGEHLDRSDVVSSIRKNPGLIADTSQVKDMRVEGIAELMLAVCWMKAKKALQGE